MIDNKEVGIVSEEELRYLYNKDNNSQGSHKLTIKEKLLDKIKYSLDFIKKLKI